MYEKRLTARLIAYWDRLRQGKPLPDIRRFNPQIIDDIWETCMRVRVDHTQGGGHGYYYEYMGQKLWGLFGRDLTGERTDSSHTSLPGADILKRMDEVLVSLATLENEGQFVNSKGRQVRYRSCLIPFGQEAVTHIIAGLSWREF